MAIPPLTLKHVNVWRGLPRGSNRVVGTINHGTKVKVMDRRECTFEGRPMARIRKGLLTGWIPAAWLSERRHAPEGELYEPAVQRAKKRRRRR